MFLIKVDDNGLFLEDCIVDAVPTVIGTDGTETADPHYTATICPEGFYHPKWNGIKWVEGGTAPEATEVTPTESQRITALEGAMLAVLLGGATNA